MLRACLARCNKPPQTHLLLKTNLRLLRSQLASLADTPYFRPRQSRYLKQLLTVADGLLNNFASIPPNVAELITREIWAATQFLAGSTTKRIPYEVVYLLELALVGFTKKSVAVTTAIIQERQFRFQGVDQDFYTYCKAWLNVDFESELIQISLPEIYRHRPLYNVALYHELGHFIDRHTNLTELTLIQLPAETNHILPGLSAKPAGMSDEHYLQLHKYHRMEFFADLFAASFTGRAIGTFLEQFAPNQPPSFTHPATYNRLQQIEALLTNKSSKIIEMFSTALAKLQLPKLQIRYQRPDLAPAFDNVRPCKITNDGEVHGVLEAGTEYLENAQQRKSPPWSNFPEEDVERIVNDLVEKSIRNRMVSDRWANGST